MNAGVCGGQVSDPLEFQLQVVVSHLVWVLGIQFGSSARVVHDLN